MAKSALDFKSGWWGASAFVSKQLPSATSLLFWSKSHNTSFSPFIKLSYCSCFFRFQRKSESAASFLCERAERRCLRSDCPLLSTSIHLICIDHLPWILSFNLKPSTFLLRHSSHEFVPFITVYYSTLIS